jgi:hypothetical protein
MEKETLEEVAERLYPVNNTGSMFMANRDELNNSLKQEGFIEGAKWQQERSYSEEEVLKLLRELNNEICEVESIKDWFEKFKKK